ncbi:MAG: DUF1080 domain-containing protein [Verrucomicrobia bacterium]|nr:DUF1080 domain-containing protein [Verrucomicrobiota bacterium]
MIAPPSPRPRPLLALLALAAFALASQAADLVRAKDGSGVYGYNDTPILPWCGFHVHDADRPAPRRVDPGPPPALSAAAPSDAVVLFDGKDMSRWVPSTWNMADGCIEAGSGVLTSRQEFGDCQIHLEWQAPSGFEGPWYNRGNNGVMLMGLYEIQIFDSFNEKIYPDGQAAAIYGQTPPLVNACRRPGEWQAFDILFVAPRFEGGTLAAPARLTLLHNGVLVHLNETIRGETGHRVLPAYRRTTSQGPLQLSGHDCPVRFRNIWVRPL